jgi:hypothetical protein
MKAIDRPMTRPPERCASWPTSRSLEPDRRVDERVMAAFDASRAA